MFRKIQPFLFAAFLALSAQGVRATDLIVDGVPLPSDAAIAATTPGSPVGKWSGAWVGLWGYNLKHILLVESVNEDGSARVVYAFGSNLRAGRRAGWLRLDGTVTGRTLRVTGERFSAVYDMTEDGGLKASFESNGAASRATMSRADFASLTKPDAAIAWTRGKSEF